MTSRVLRLLLLIVAAALAGGVGGSLCAQETRAPRGDDPAAAVEKTGGKALAFRRVYVPEERLLEVVPRGFYPFVREEFEQLSQLLKKDVTAPRQLRGASLRRAEYYAVLDDDLHLRGRAILAIERHRPGTAAVPLEPLNIAVTAPFWRDQNTSASLGLDQDGRYVVAVGRENLLELSWSRRGVVDAFGTIEIPLMFPPSLVRVLSVDLPQELKLEASGGIVEEAGSQPSPAADLMQLPPADAGARRWRIELTGAQQVVVRVSRRESEDSGATMFRQSCVYEVQPQGVTLAGELRLDVQGPPVRELSLTLNQDLRLTAVKLQDRSIPFEVSVDDPTQVALRFPEPIGGSGNLVRFAAQAPLVMDQEWRLPAVQVREAIWQSGQTEIQLSDLLTLKKLHLADCIQTHTAPGKGGHALAFRNYSSDANVSLVVSRHESRVRARAGTSVDFGPANASATTVFQLEAPQGERFVLSAAIAPEWIVDSVAATTDEETPQDVLEGVTIPAPGGSREPLEVRLSRPLQPGLPIRVTVRAHRRLTGESAFLTRQDLRVVELRDVKETSRFIAIAPESPYQAVLTNDTEFLRLDANNLPPEAAGLVAASSASVVFQDTGAGGNVRAALTRATPNFSGEIAMAALANETTLRESYRIRVTPISSRVEQLQVHFSRRRPGEVTWGLSESPEQAVLARRVESEGAEEGETWELRFDRSRDAAFTLEAERVVEFDSSHELAFASLPQANAQQGELTVRAASGVTLALHTSGLKPTPAAPGLPGEYPTTSGVFRYEPTQQPAATLVRSDDAPTARAWVRLLELQSDFPLDGRPHHTVVCHVENAGKPALLLALPADAELRHVRVDGETVAKPERVAPSGALRVSLPAGVRFPRVEIEYLHRRQRVGLWRTFSPQPPEIDAPVLSRHWTVRLPPSLALAPPLDGRRGFEDPSWDVRLLGPLRRRLPWLADADADATPTPSASPGGEARRQGWNVHRQAWSDEKSPQAHVFRTDVVTTLLLSLFLSATVCLSWLAARTGFLVWLFGSVAGVAALWAPSPYYVLFTTLFLSAVVAAVVSVTLARRRRTATFEEDSSATALLPVSVCLAAAVLSAGTAANVVYGQAEPAAGSPLHPVFIPVDSEGKPSDNDKYVYVPQTLYAALQQTARQFEAPPRPWLLRSANYRAVLGWRPSGAEIGCQRIEVDWELEVLTAPTRVELPLPWRQAGVGEESIRLDGRLLSPSESNEANTLAFNVDEVGIFRLEIELRPAAEARDGQFQIDLAIPRTPQAALKVFYPGDLKKLRLPTVMGRVTPDEALGEVSSELGPAGRLRIAWPQVVEESVRLARPPHVEQLLWLNIQPDALVLDVKWKFLGNGEPIEAIEVLTDDNLTFLPSTARGLAGFTTVRRDDLQALRLQFDRPRVTPFEFQASFVVQGAVGVGAPRLPWLEIQHAAVARRWLGVSLDPALESPSVAAEHAERIAETLFRSNWGEAPAAPHFAYRLLRSDSGWTAQTRFRRLPLTGRAAVSVVYRRDHAQVLCEADLDAGKGHSFLLQLAAPKAFRVESASVVENGVERVDHWSQDDAGRLIIFFNGRVSGAHRLSIQGQLPVPARGRHTAPLLSLADGSRWSTTYRVYRGPDVALRIVKAEGLTPEADAPLGEYGSSLGRLAAAYTLAADAGASQAETKPPDLVVEITPNRPRTLRRQLVTMLTPREDAWIVTTELTLDVNQGVVDVVRLEAPQRMAGPFTLDPPGRLESQELPHLGRRLLTIRPDRPLAGNARVRVSGFLRPPPGESLRAPNIEPLDLGETAQFFVLPLEWQGQPIAWEPYGMRADVLPPSFDHSDAAMQVAAYRVVNKPRYGAVVRHVEQAVGDPQVRLADIRATLRSPRDFFATASFDLEPAGLQECVLQLPVGARLVHAAIQGLAATPVRLNRRSYAFDLNGERLPLRLVVIYEGDLAAQEGEPGLYTVSAPALLGLPVERAVWTVNSETADHRLAAAEDERPVSLRQQDLLRLQALASLLDLSLDVEAEHSRDELARWYFPWMRQWASVRERVAKAAPRGASPDDALLLSLDEAQAMFAVRYGAEHLQAGPGDYAAGAPFAPEETSPLVTPTAVRAETPGGALSLRVRVAPAGAATPPTRMWIAAGAVLLSGALFWRLRRAEQAEWLSRWFPLVCVLVGIAWWLWLTPLWVGLLMVATGAASSFRPRRGVPLTGFASPSSLASSNAS